ncbi:MAG: GNAT family N-acetyltransferase, partial [Nocardioides sp.]
VHPSARRRGVAHALVQRCIARSRELGDHRVVICSDRAMHTAHRLYTRLGFVRAPERDWSPVPGVDLIAFTVDL